MMFRLSWLSAASSREVIEVLEHLRIGGREVAALRAGRVGFQILTSSSDGRATDERLLVPSAPSSAEQAWRVGRGQGHAPDRRSSAVHHDGLLAGGLPGSRRTRGSVRSLQQGPARAESHSGGSRRRSRGAQCSANAVARARACLSAGSGPGSIAPSAGVDWTPAPCGRAPRRGRSVPGRPVEREDHLQAEVVRRGAGRALHVLDAASRVIAPAVQCGLGTGTAAARRRAQGGEGRGQGAGPAPPQLQQRAVRRRRRPASTATMGAAWVAAAPGRPRRPPRHRPATPADRGHLSLRRA